MEDLLLQVWSYMEKAGVASAVIMSILLVWARKDLREVQAKYDLAQEKRIEDGRNAIGVITTNTAETRTLIELVRGLNR